MNHPVEEHTLPLHENEISRQILDSAIEVHRTFGGPGLLEAVYEEALAMELRNRGLPVGRQVSLPITYKGQSIGTPLRIDLVVAGKVVVECKAVSEYNSLFAVQTLTYLRLSELKLGLVINFGAPTIKDGFHRIVNGL